MKCQRFERRRCALTSTLSNDCYVIQRAFFINANVVTMIMTSKAFMRASRDMDAMQNFENSDDMPDIGSIKQILKHLANNARTVIEQRNKAEVDGVVNEMVGVLIDTTFDAVQINSVTRMLEDDEDETMFIMEQERKLKNSIVRNVMDELFDQVFDKIENTRTFAEAAQIAITPDGMLLILFTYICFTSAHPC